MKFIDEDDYDEELEEEEEDDVEGEEEEEEGEDDMDEEEDENEEDENDEEEDEEEFEELEEIESTNNWEANTGGNDGEYSLDLFNLSVFNYHPLQLDADNLETELLQGTKLATQQIING